MADSKISALTGATTPLAGTEVLPIVQGGATVKVAVSNLTAGRAVSATQLTSTIATGTAPLVVASTTNVPNLNASSIGGATFAAPGAIGGGTAAAGSFTTLAASGVTAIGLAAKSWGGPYSVLQVGDGGIMVDPTIPRTRMLTNAYYNGTNFKYATTTSAFQFLADSNAGAYYWQYAASGTAGNNITFGELMSLSSTGLAVTGTLSATGNITPTTAAKGIAFTANTPAAGMTSQLLNWYEEGTWTPVITPATGSLTAYTSSGTYVRVGKTVTLTCAFKIITAGTATDGADFAGVPFTSQTMSIGTVAATCLVREVFGSGLAYQGRLASNATTGSVYSMTNGPIVWSANFTYVFTMVYQCA